MTKYLNNITDFLTKTDFTAIEDSVWFLSDNNMMDDFIHNQLPVPQMRRLNCKMMNAISEICNCADELNEHIKTLLTTFVAPSYEMIRSTRHLLSLECLDTFQQNCDFLKEEWGILEHDEENVIKDVRRNKYSNWEKHLKTLYPPEQDDGLREQVIKKILFLYWTLHKTDVIMSNFINEVNRIRADCPKSYTLFLQQKADLEKRIEEYQINPNDISNIERYANNPLVKALHGKENKDNVSKLYHYYSDDGSRDITEHTMIEYILYEKAVAYQKELKKSELNKNLILVMGDSQKDFQIKNIIDHLPEITTLRKKNNEPYVDSYFIAFLVVLAGENGCGKSIHNYIKQKHKAASSYGGVSPKVQKIRDDIVKKRKPKSDDLYQKYCYFCDEVRTYHQKTVNPLLPSSSPTTIR